MTKFHPIEQLAAQSRTFGRAAAREKLRLLDEISRLKRHSARRIILLHDTLYFMRAYPDTPQILGAVESSIRSLRESVDDYTGGDPLHSAFLNSGVPGSCNTYPYSYAVLQRLVQLHHDLVEIDWDEFLDDSLLAEALYLTVLPAEARGIEDEYATLREWLQHSKTDPRQTDLAVVLHLFQNSGLTPQQQMHVFESCEVPIRYCLSEPGSGRGEVALTPDRVFYQRTPIRRERFRLEPRIVRPLRKHRLLQSRAGREMLDFSLDALCCRNLEIQPLIYANPEDVTVVDCDRGVQVILAGTLSEFRPVMESDFFFLILKNGVPIAYGPASVFARCCEMGINLFPEFRGGEIRYIYAQFMKALFHLAHVRYFFLTSYGMGEDNPDALKSGAFWFYRKLGFKPTNPDVDDLARKEEKIIRRRPGHRSSMKTLRKLSDTEAYLDLSRGVCQPTDFEAIGQAVTRHISQRFFGDRRKAERKSTRWVAQALDIRGYAGWTPREKRAMQQWSLLIALLPGIESWPGRERRSVAAIVKAKGASSELDYVRRVAGFPKLLEALQVISD
jgi:hypothetical protein